MKKIIVLLITLLMASPLLADVVTVDAFISPDDVTIAHLEQFRTRVVDGINNFDGANIQAGTITHTALDANSDPVNRWNEAFNDWVYTGLLPATGTRAAAVISAGTAYIYGMRVVKDETTPGATNYPATSWIFVDLSNNGTFTYTSQVIGTAVEPAVATNSIRLGRVTTNATDVTAVRDDRVLAITLGSTQEDFYKNGLGLIYNSATAFTVDAGVTYNGSTRVSKTSTSAVDISSASDYITGVSGRAANIALYAYTSPTGQMRLSTSAPDKHDTSGNTAGIKNYYYYPTTTTYYRYLGTLSLDASQNIVSRNLSSTELPGKVVQVVSYQTGELVTTSVAIPYDDTIPQITEGGEAFSLAITPTSATNKLRIDVVMNYNAAGDHQIGTALFQDNTANALAAMCSDTSQANGNTNASFTHYMTAGTTSPTTFKVRFGTTDASAVSLNSSTAAGARMYGGVMASSITITEYTP